MAEPARRSKTTGSARYIGVTAAQAALYGQLEAFLERERPDFVEINYSVTERDAERLLPLLADRGIAVLISRPFMNGAYFERLANVPLPTWAAEFECDELGAVLAAIHLRRTRPSPAC